MTQNDNNAGLGRSIAKGGLILVMLRLSLRLIGLASVMILFRILVPDDFGLASLAMTVVGFSEVLAEFGFEQLLMQKQNAQRSDYDVTWTLTFLRGCFCTIVLLLIAFPAAEFLKDPRLGPMVLWLALGPLIDGLNNAGLIDFSKKLQFGKEFRFRISLRIAGFCLTMALALWLRNYWALVFGTLGGKLMGVALGYVIHPYRPRFDLRGSRIIFKFSIWIMLNSLILFAGGQTDKVLLQRYYDAYMVGIFRMAEEICSVVMELVWPVEKALNAGYARLAGNLAELRRTVLNSVGLVSMIGIPTSIGILLVAEPLVAIMLGDKGRATVPFIQVLVLHGAIRSCIGGVLPVFYVLGKPRINTQLTFLAILVRLTVLFTGFSTLGAMAAPWALVAGSCANFVAVWIYAKHSLKLSWWDFPKALWRAAAATAMMVYVVQQVTDKLHGASGNNWLLLSVQVATGVIVYFLSVLVLWFLSGRPKGPEDHILHEIRMKSKKWFMSN